MEGNEDSAASMPDPADADPARPAQEGPLARPPAWRERVRARVALRWPDLGPALEGFDPRVTAIMLVASVALLVFKKLGSSGTFIGDLAPGSLRGHPRLTVMADFYWFLSSFVMLGLVPLATLRALDGPIVPERIGLGAGDRRAGLRGVAILFGAMLPVLVLVSRSPSFAEYYPLNEQLGRQVAEAVAGEGTDPWAWFVAYELLYVVYFLGWEFFFRGFLLFGLWERFGFDAILIANVPFVLMHAGKPLAEALGSAAAGIALGVFAWRTRSCWYCWALHAAIAVTMDLLAIERRVELILFGG